MTRETELADLYRADDVLRPLVPGGIYADALLPPTGLTNAKTMTKVWANGVFNNTIVVRERAPVPTGELQSIRSQRTSMSQAIGVWVYAKDAEEIELILAHVYRLTMGKRLPNAYSATWVGGSPTGQAPELPPGILTRHEDYRVVSIRMPVEL